MGGDANSRRSSSVRDGLGRIARGHDRRARPGNTDSRGRPRAVFDSNGKRAFTSCSLRGSCAVVVGPGEATRSTVDGLACAVMRPSGRQCWA